VVYARAPRLFEELRIAHGDGSFGKRLLALAKTDLLILDDWGLAPLGQAERNDLLEESSASIRDSCWRYESIGLH
jgi:DNA replication protein DnaC